MWPFRKKSEESKEKSIDEKIEVILKPYFSIINLDRDLEFKKTWLETFHFRNKKMSIEDIAIERKLTPSTIAKHMMALIKMKVVTQFEDIMYEKYYSMINTYIRENFTEADFSPYDLYDQQIESPFSLDHIDLYLCIEKAKSNKNPNANHFRFYNLIYNIYSNPKTNRDEKILALRKYDISHKEIGSLTNCHASTVREILSGGENIKLKNLKKQVNKIKEVNRGPIYNKESKTERKERINSNLKFIDEHISDHVAFGKVSSLIKNNGKADSKNELMSKFVLHPSQLDRLKLIAKNNGNLTKCADELGITKLTIRKSIRSIKGKGEFFNKVIENLLRTSSYLEKDETIISLIQNHYLENKKAANWESNVLESINLLVKGKNKKTFTRQEFLKKFIAKLKTEFPLSKTPEQTVSRVFQDLIKKKKLKQIASGKYELLPLFNLHQEYSREDVKKILNIKTKRGPYERGYWEHEGQMFIFANVGIPGVTGHDYNNYWDSDILRWEGDKISGIESGRIQLLLDQEIETHIFTRETPKGLFTYEGIGIAQDVKDTLPVQISWAFEIGLPKGVPLELDDNVHRSKSTIPKELKRKEKLIEKYWGERNALMEEFPDIPLSKIFNYIEFCMLEEGITLGRGKLIKWFRETQQDSENPIEITYQKNIIAYSRIPYKQILADGLPKPSAETIIEYHEKFPKATISHISKATGIKIDTVRNILKREGLVAKKLPNKKENDILKFIKKNPGCTREMVLKSVDVSSSHLSRVVKKHNIISSSDHGLVTLRIGKTNEKLVETQEEKLSILWTPKYGIADVLAKQKNEVIVGVSFPVDSDLLKLPCYCYINEADTGVKLKTRLKEIIRFGRPDIPENKNLLIEGYKSRKFVTFFRLDQLQVLENKIATSEFKKKDGKPVKDARNYTIIVEK